MELENRYIVFKRSDYKDHPEVLELLEFQQHEAFHLRDYDNRPQLECLVIEKDWPEYKPALLMLEARVDGKGPCLMITQKDLHKMESYEAKYKNLIKFIQGAPVSSGVCQCGESMNDHRCNDHVAEDVWDHNVKYILDEAGKV